MAKNYIRVENKGKVRSAIELIQNYMGYIPDADSVTAEWAIQEALDAFCVEHFEGYNIFTGKVEKEVEHADSF